MKKYYVEIYPKDDREDYVAQSCWFDTKKAALHWASQITFVSPEFEKALMSAKWNQVIDTYVDIVQEQVLADSSKSC